MNPAECNYPIYDKKIAGYRAFFLEIKAFIGILPGFFDVYTDY
jgi:hypothetical protein